MPTTARDGALPTLGVGLAGGIVAGLLGVGGGVIMVPALTMVLGRAQHVAHATSLVAVAMAATAGALRFGLESAVAPIAALAIVAGSWSGARWGADLASRISEERLRLAFAAMLAVVAVRFLLPGSEAAQAVGVGTTAPIDATTLAALVVAGLVAGITSSLLGVGGGVILVPVMVLALGFDQHIAEGTSLAAIVPTALRGANRHTRNGYTDWPLGLRLGAGAVVGALAGSSLALRLGAEELSQIFGVLLLVLSGLTVLRSRTRNTEPHATTQDPEAP